MTDTLEDTARRIADGGRETLVARLRPVFEQAAAANADVLKLTPQQLDRMVSYAVDGADGVQWRRALASAATEELGIAFAEAINHPAVARAQEIVGAPSYEASLAERAAAREAEKAAAREADEKQSEKRARSGAREAEREAEREAAREAERRAAAAAAAPASGTQPEAGPVAAAGAPPEPAAAADAPPEPAPAADAPPEPAPAADTPPEPAPAADAPPELTPATAAPPEAAPANRAARATPTPPPPPDTAEPDAAQPDAEDEPLELRLLAVHLGGIANLAPAEPDLELRLSDQGLDIVRGGGAVFGRLAWEDIRTLDVVDGRSRGVLGRRATQLVVRSDRGNASFEVPGVSSAELREFLAPMLTGRT